MITLDGWQVPGFDTKVNAGVKLAGKDLSGGGSFGLSSDDGVKPGVLTVSTKVPFAKLEQLTELIDRSKALDENGARVIRTVNCDIAKVYKIRKAKFDGDIKSNEDEKLKVWLGLAIVSEKQKFGTESKQK